MQETDGRHRGHKAENSNGNSLLVKRLRDEVLLFLSFMWHPCILSDLELKAHTYKQLTSRQGRHCNRSLRQLFTLLLTGGKQREMNHAQLTLPLRSSPEVPLRMGGSSCFDCSKEDNTHQACPEGHLSISAVISGLFTLTAELSITEAYISSFLRIAPKSNQQRSAVSEW